MLEKPKGQTEVMIHQLIVTLSLSKTNNRIFLYMYHRYNENNTNDEKRCEKWLKHHVNWSKILKCFTSKMNMCNIFIGGKLTSNTVSKLHMHIMCIIKAK